jgi:hypothetical protein
VREGFAESGDFGRTVLWALMLDAPEVWTVSTARSPGPGHGGLGRLRPDGALPAVHPWVPLQPAPDGRPRAQSDRPATIAAWWRRRRRGRQAGPQPCAPSA